MIITVKENKYFVALPHGAFTIVKIKMFDRV